MDDSNPAGRLRKISEQLIHAPKLFFSEPFGFSWWLRGGEPGSQSDKLDLESTGGIIQGTYVQARFDRKREPPTYSEKFSRTVDAAHAAAILKGVFDSELFSKHFNEEDDRGMRDIQKETWTFSRGNEQFTKTLFAPLPESLAALRQLIREQADYIAHKGRT